MRVTRRRHAYQNITKSLAGFTAHASPTSHNLSTAKYKIPLTCITGIDTTDNAHNSATIGLIATER